MTIKRTLWNGVSECSTPDKNTQGRKQSAETKQNSDATKLTAKDRARIKIMEFLANSENGFLTWNHLSTEACNYKNSRHLYTIFTIEERCEIEQTALIERRKNYSRHTAAIDFALFKKAQSGDPAAIKLWYQRIEGWSEKQQCEYPDENGVPQKITPQIYNTIRMNQISNDDRAAATRLAMLKALGPEREI